MKDSPYTTVNLKERNREELQGLLVQLKRELFDLRIMQATSQLKNNNKLNSTRQNVARVMTEINARRASGRKQ
ncbi:50S ribosomal protein L29 [Myxococcota bacterium]|nr:50S ribosomal protein L29 [Myxococcota bacterium]